MHPDKKRAIAREANKSRTWTIKLGARNKRYVMSGNKLMELHAAMHRTGKIRDHEFKQVLKAISQHHESAATEGSKNAYHIELTHEKKNVTASQEKASNSNGE